MVVSDASYPQLLSLVGSGARYQSCCSKTQAFSQLATCGWLDVWSLQRLLPLWAGKQLTLKRSLCLRCKCGGFGAAGSATLGYFFFSTAVYLGLLLPCFHIYRSSIVRRRRRSRKWGDLWSLGRIKRRPQNRRQRWPIISVAQQIGRCLDL